jgi:hypothetical protein
MYSDLPEDEPRRLAITNMQEDLIALHVQLINYALEPGFTYERWTQVANAMLFKEPGNTKIHRTRVIHIYEADYNLAMGLKWRAALQLAENHNLLNPGQYGVTPIKRSTRSSVPRGDPTGDFEAYPEVSTANKLRRNILLRSYHTKFGSVSQQKIWSSTTSNAY